MSQIIAHNGEKLRITQTISESDFSVRYAQNTNFYVIEADFSLTTSSANQDLSLLLKRFIDACNSDSRLAKITNNPLSKKLGVSYKQTNTNGQITGSFQLPKATWLNRKIHELDYDCAYKFVEHEGAHINHWQYIDYLAKGEYPLANSLCWQLIHDRIDHVIGALTTPTELLKHQRDFAKKTLKLKNINLEQAEQNSLILTDFVDELTYKTTIQANEKDNPTKVLQLVFDELNNKHSNSSNVIEQILPTNVLSNYFANSLEKARLYSA